ncbi:hypothetical protein GCM10023347_11340 [Streptomyces chumphonensis]
MRAGRAAVAHTRFPGTFRRSRLRSEGEGEREEREMRAVRRKYRRGSGPGDSFQPFAVSRSGCAPASFAAYVDSGGAGRGGGNGRRIRAGANTANSSRGGRR